MLQKYKCCVAYFGSQEAGSMLKFTTPAPLVPSVITVILREAMKQHSDMLSEIATGCQLSGSGFSRRSCVPAPVNAAAGSGRACQ
jgi:hypothetical protein